ncbi:MAG: tetratricopeptide repeat-containing sensor histidine kinase [Ignavibacteriaceae bacterium]|nr:tetratricopeptide repeat-containing sensor histidine kinase [Ignavibacteriaceae bacterium]
MKKNSVIFVFVLLLHITAVAQQLFDSLNGRINNLPDSTKVQRLIDFMWEARRNNPADGILAGEEALRLTESPELVRFLPKVHNFLGVVHRNAGNYRDALKQFTLALNISLKLGNKEQTAYSYNNLGAIHRLLGNFPLALENTLKALQYFESVNDDQGVSFCAINLGVLYRRQFMFEKAEEMYHKALDIRIKRKDRTGEVQVLTHLGDLYFEMNDFQKAEEYYQLTRFANEELGDKKGLASAIAGLAKISEIKQDHQTALRLRKEALAINKDAGNSEGMVNDYAFIIQLLGVTGNFAEGIRSEAEALEIAGRVNSIYLYKNLYEALCKLYELKGDSRTALRYALLNDEMKDSIYSVLTLEKIAQTEALHNVKQIELEAEAAKNEAAKQSTQNLFLLIFLTAALILASIIFILYKKNRKKNAELSAANQIKDKLFGLLAHDLRNPFQTILGYCEILDEDFNQLSDDEKKFYINALRQASINNYEFLENMLSWSLTNMNSLQVSLADVELSDLLSRVIRQIKYKAGQKEIKIRFRKSGEYYALADRDMLNSVFRNILWNAVKFTEAGGSIEVEIAELNTSAVISVTDNGIGMSKENLDRFLSGQPGEKSRGTNGERGSGLGMIIVKEFLEKHKGNLKVDSAPGKGTLVTVYLPLKNYVPAVSANFSDIALTDQP